MTLSVKIRERLIRFTERLEELHAMLADPEAAQDASTFQALSKEHGELQPLADAYQRYAKVEDDIAQAEEMAATETDEELKQLAQEEIEAKKEEITGLESELEVLLLPKDPNDEKNVFVEIRAGTGGDEAALFAGDLLRLYTRYAERQGWSTALTSYSESELGGYKEAILEVSGKGAFSKLKFESGGHRVQRVPETETQGRIHTSACTVAVMPQVDEITGIAINPSDLRIDTYRASGAGGQHINKTDSAVRITHLPTGIVVACQEDRSQHKNKARAMSVLAAKLLEEEQQKQSSSQASARKLMIGSGDRSERIRTYNFPQGRVTDHRINLTLYKLEDILDGDLEPLIGPLTQEHQADLIASLNQE